MLQRDLKKIANESVFNPNKPSINQRIVLDVGDTQYYMTKAMERVAFAKTSRIGGTLWHAELKQAIELLILARGIENEKSKEKTKRAAESKKENNKLSDSTV